MRRRSQRERRMPVRSGRTLFQQVLALSAGRPIFLASGHITLSGTGDVLSVHDWNDDAHVLTQADTAKQCDPPAASANYNNQLVLIFTGAEYYDSNRPASDWQYLTGGEGYDFWGVVERPTDGTRCVWTLSWSSGNERNALYLATANFLTRVTSGGVSRFALTCVVPAAGTPTRLHCAYDEAAIPEVRLQANSLTLATTTTAGSTSASAATTFRLGDFVTGGGRFVGAIGAATFYPTLSTPQRDTVKQYIQQTFGIAA
jgi:hypothetical protein